MAPVTIRPVCRSDRSVIHLPEGPVAKLIVAMKPHQRFTLPGVYEMDPITRTTTDRLKEFIKV